MTYKRHLAQVKHDYKNNKERKYIGFWGSREDTWEENTFSNFYQTYFKVDVGREITEYTGEPYKQRQFTFSSNEQYFMFTKALHFKDFTTMEKILKNGYSPDDYKGLGRQVRNYDDQEWSKVRYDYMKKGLKYKYSQNEQLKELLLNTKDAVIVETSPFDKIWGVGLGKTRRHRGELIVNEWQNPFNWKGQNLLGFALMDVREEFLKHEE